MNKQILFWAGGVLVIIVGLLLFRYYPIDDVAVTSTTPTSLKNATYVVNGQSITLTNGVSVAPTVVGSALNVTTQYFGNEATGDLNGDGFSDTAFVLTQNSGGSGMFYYVAVALGYAQGYKGTNAILLGDRIAPQTTEIKNGQVIVNFADRKAGEAMTALPSVGVSKYFNVSVTQLAETTNPNDTSIIYKNTDYGFSFYLPTKWQGYSIVKTTWKGTALTNIVPPSGATIIIRNPKWTEAVHYEDIPIMVFTLSQWDSYLAEKFSVSAAPIQASELARNNIYVFALPPRWDFDYSLEYKEAQDIIAGSPLRAYNL